MENDQSITIRIGAETMSFAAVNDADCRQIDFEPYTYRMGVSVAANLRDAFTTSMLLRRGYSRVRVLMQASTMLVPTERFVDEDEQALFSSVFTVGDGMTTAHHVVNDLNAVAVFGVSKDLLLVLNDHFRDVKVMPLMSPVWQHLHKRSFSGMRRKLYAYFHDGVVDVCAFRLNRFVFANAFDAASGADAAYYVLGVWQQLAMDDDAELFVVGDAAVMDEAVSVLVRFVGHVHTIGKAAEFNRAPLAQIDGVSFDLAAYFLKK